MKFSSLQSLIALLILAAFMGSCKKETPTPDPVFTECELVKTSKFDNNDLFEEGEILEYDAFNNISKKVELGIAEEVLFVEEYTYLTIGGFLSNILKTANRYNASGDLISYIDYAHDTILEQIVVSSATLRVNGSSFISKEEYEYNGSGKQIKHSHYIPNTLLSNDSLVYDSTYNHNSFGLIANYTYYNYSEEIGESMTFEYDNNLNITKEIRYNEQGILIEEFIYLNTYGAGYRLSQQDKIGEAGIVVSYKTYEYNDYQNSVQITRYSGGNDLKSMQRLTYNDLDDLLENYNYDNVTDITTTWKYDYECE